MVATLLRGITFRLESSIIEIRKSGMRVAETLAERLGQNLRFDDLDGERHDQIAPISSKAVEGDVVEKCKEEKSMRHPRREKTLDPDAEYESSDDDGSNVEPSWTSEGVLHDDSSVEYEDGLIPYNLDDDEEDLRETSIPLYLRDCLALLRTPESEELASSHHRTALDEVAKLVRSHPADLHDVAIPLARQLLCMENKFDIEEFAGNRMKGLVALTVEEPTVVGEFLISEVFKSAGLATHLDILTTLEHASLELCGLEALSQKKLEQRRDAPAIEYKKHRDEETRNDYQGSSTRRWRRPRDEPQGVVNRFSGHIAGLWFYSLVGRFMENKQDTALWAGANGARLLSGLLLTLSCIVDCSGPSLDTEVLARNLVEFAWSFEDTNVPELRSSVLVALSSSLANLADEILASVLARGPLDYRRLRHIAIGDPDSTCRRLASALIQRCEASDPLIVIHSTSTKTLTTGRVETKMQ
eukprot:CAMPEP_0116825060 /NCGR_PEP_ID=MMETSP0418-20121206/1749_1 /TAXON_ID=1158023 /ORGANISM="Astrosyne radiata, Strain 13vi08-1A" /LENGTH=470 /DNA_ID=CAMNT_0004453513 /DNA_START=112 /DNA_END=1524 /DNA_ORIENTATION=-